MRVVWLVVALAAVAAARLGRPGYWTRTKMEQDSINTKAKELGYKVHVTGWSECVPFARRSGVVTTPLPKVGVVMRNIRLGNQTRKVNCISKEGAYVDPDYCGTYMKMVETARTCLVKLDCVLGDWLPWEMRPDGSLLRLRRILQFPQGGGEECPVVAEMKPASIDPNAHWETGQWDACKVAVEKTRTVKPESEDDDDSMYDDIDDEADEYDEERVAARARCGGGTQRREAHCVTSERRAIMDENCAHLPMPTLVQPCEVPCPRDCEVGPWSEWGPCLPVDGCPIFPVQQLTSTGYSIRHRRVTSAASGGGAPCPPLEERRACASPRCAAWRALPWGPCTLERAAAGCGPGRRTRDLRCLGHDGKEAARAWCAGGLAPARSERCRVACAGDCVVSAWGAWGACSAVCAAPGLPPPTRARHRHILAPASDSGWACPPPEQLVQHEACNTHACATYSWLTTPWGPCERRSDDFVPSSNYTDFLDGDITAEADADEPCIEEGEMTRDVMCVQNNADIVRESLCAPLRRPAVRRACTVRCRRGCKLGPWMPWSECPDDCTPSKQVRLREVRGGARCGSHVQMRDCPKRTHCKEERAIWMTTDFWSPCVMPDNSPCGKGLSIRQTWCGSNTRRLELGACADQPVPRAAVPCARTCGRDLDSCQLICSDPLHYVDYSEMDVMPVECACANLTLELLPTDSDCILPVGMECGEGITLRSARCLYKGKHVPMDVCRAYHPLTGVHRVSDPATDGYTYDEEFPGLLRGACSVPCARDCALGPWGEWGPCTPEAGALAAYRFRSREVVVESAAGGRECGATLQRAPCERPAPRWRPADWGVCAPHDARCGPAIMNRTVTCVDGEGRAVEEAACSSQPAPAREAPCRAPCDNDCVVSPWSEWSHCELTKWGGRRDRTRVVLRAAGAGGARCPPLVSAEPCAALLYSWHAAPWADCQPLGGSPCGEGIKRRAVRCLRSDGIFVNDSFCDNTTAREPAESWCYVACGADCTVAMWGEWDRSACRCDNPNAHMRRTRQRLTAPVWPGRSCPPIEQRAPCPAPPCMTLLSKPVTQCTVMQGHDEMMYCGTGVKLSRVRCQFDWDRNNSNREDWTMEPSRCTPILPGRLSMPHDEWEETPCDIPCRCNESSAAAAAGEWGRWSPCRGGVRSRRRQLAQPHRDNCPNINKHLTIQWMNCTDEEESGQEFPIDLEQVKSADLADDEYHDGYLEGSGTLLAVVWSATVFLGFYGALLIYRGIIGCLRSRQLKTVSKV